MGGSRAGFAVMATEDFLGRLGRGEARMPGPSCSRQDAGAVQNSFIGWAYLSFLVSGGSPKLCSMVVKRL